MQRLEQEYGAAVVTTTPTVPYRITMAADGRAWMLERASDFPLADKVGAGVQTIGVHAPGAGWVIDVLYASCMVVLVARILCGMARCTGCVHLVCFAGSRHAGHTPLALAGSYTPFGA